MNPSEVIAAMYAGEVLVFGHRGARAYAPQNTIPAFELAVQQGAQGVELDVHRSRDGQLVIMHNFDVDETTDGSGRITEKTLAEIKALDAGSKFAPEFAGTPVPTLDEVFEVVGKRLFINVEIKSESLETDGVEQLVADCIRRHAMETRVIISSFNPLALSRFRAALPDVPIGFLYAKESPAVAFEAIKAIPHEAKHPHFSLIDAALMTEARANGRIVNAWTVNDPAEARALVVLGVSGIITDAPDVILGALKS